MRSVRFFAAFLPIPEAAITADRHPPTSRRHPSSTERGMRDPQCLKGANMIALPAVALVWVLS